MWERISKLQIQHAIAAIVIIGCFTIAIIALFRPIPPDAKDLINKLFDITLVGTIGFLYTASKNTKQQ